MATLKKSERRLFALFLFTLFCAASWYLWKYYSDRRAAADDLAHQLLLEEAEIETLLEQRDQWLQRDAWLETHQPQFTSRDQVDNQLLEEARASGVPGVRTGEFVLIEPTESSAYLQSGVRFVARGSLQDVFTWLHQLQRPEEFRVVRSLSVSSVKDDPTAIKCEVELLRWYQPALNTTAAKRSAETEQTDVSG